ncbi:MAG: YicC/YloC family endoribonuclease [Pirellulales bacterium]
MDTYLGEKHIPHATSIDALLALPGVVNEASVNFEQAEAAWPLIESTLREALTHLEKMRADEGRNMGRDLTENCRIIAGEVDAIAARRR